MALRSYMPSYPGFQACSHRVWNRNNVRMGAQLPVYNIDRSQSYMFAFHQSYDLSMCTRACSCMLPLLYTAMHTVYMRRGWLALMIRSSTSTVRMQDEGLSTAVLRTTRSRSSTSSLGVCSIAAAPRAHILQLYTVLSTAVQLYRGSTRRILQLYRSTATADQSPELEAPARNYLKSV